MHNVQRKLLSTLNNAANVISRSSRTGSANYIITSKETYEALKTLMRKLKIKRIFNE